jgi:Mn-dependent DtxR family transcriptional regulator
VDQEVDQVQRACQVWEVDLVVHLHIQEAEADQEVDLIAHILEAEAEAEVDQVLRLVTYQAILL